MSVSWSLFCVLLVFFLLLLTQQVKSKTSSPLDPPKITRSGADRADIVTKVDAARPAGGTTELVDFDEVRVFPACVGVRCDCSVKKKS